MLFSLAMCFSLVQDWNDYNQPNQLILFIYITDINVRSMVTFTCHSINLSMSVHVSKNFYRPRKKNLYLCLFLHAVILSILIILLFRVFLFSPDHTMFSSNLMQMHIYYNNTAFYSDNEGHVSPFLFEGILQHLYSSDKIIFEVLLPLPLSIQEGDLGLRKEKTEHYLW